MPPQLSSARRAQRWSIAHAPLAHVWGDMIFKHMQMLKDVEALTPNMSVSEGAAKLAFATVASAQAH